MNFVHWTKSSSQENRTHNRPNFLVHFLQNRHVRFVIGSHKEWMGLCSPPAFLSLRRHEKRPQRNRNDPLAHIHWRSHRPGAACRYVQRRIETTCSINYYLPSGESCCEVDKGKVVSVETFIRRKAFLNLSKRLTDSNAVETIVSTFILSGRNNLYEVSVIASYLVC